MGGDTDLEQTSRGPDSGESDDEGADQDREMELEYGGDSEDNEDDDDGRGSYADMGDENTWADDTGDMDALI